MLCFKNAQPIEQIALIDRAFHYGDGCFTTARVRQGKIELENLHIARLVLSCERLLLQANLQCIEQSLAVLQQQYLQVNGTLKVLISRGEGQRGYSLPDHHADVWVFFYPQACAEFQVEKINTGFLYLVLGLIMVRIVCLISLICLDLVLVNF